MKEKIIKAFSKDNLFYTLIAIISFAIIITNRVIVGFHPVLWLCDVASVFSILYTINMAKHNVFGFIFNIIATATMVVTSFYQHIWLNATVCLCVNLPSMIIGLVNWIKNEKKGKEEDNLKSMSGKTLALFVLATLAFSSVFTYILYLLDGTLFYIDGIFSALCMVGVILASKMYIEQYYFFIPANILGIVLYVILCFKDMSNLPYVVTNIIFTIVSILGYLNWRKLKKEQDNLLLSSAQSSNESSENEGLKNDDESVNNAEK